MKSLRRLAPFATLEEPVAMKGPANQHDVRWLVALLTFYSVKRDLFVIHLDLLLEKQDSHETYSKTNNDVEKYCLLLVHISKMSFKPSARIPVSFLKILMLYSGRKKKERMEKYHITFRFLFSLNIFFFSDISSL